MASIINTGISGTADCGFVLLVDDPIDRQRRIPMKDNEKRFHSIVNNAPAMTWVSDPGKEALSRFVGRLIDAQDQEHMKIAQELHADIGSSLSIVILELLKAASAAAVSTGKENPDLPEICKKLEEIGSKISRLSSQLDPPMLKYFGLARAIESECQALSKEIRIPVSCVCTGIPEKPDAVVALNLLKVAKEALCNAGKHSRAAKISLNASATSNELTLTISDNGVGFEVERMPPAEGLGLISMLERMRLIGGAFEIRSQPGLGTQIKCTAPLVPSGTIRALDPS
jgi:signal transduction histidine kinase